MKEIKLTQDKVALVDDEDYDRVSQFSWRAEKKNHTFYAVRGNSANSDYWNLAEFILGVAPYGHVWDHKDSNGLNCQRSNLRLATYSQNVRNQVKRTDNTSGYKGVSFRSINNKYRATITINGKAKHLGYFANPLDAARKYDDIAKLHFGEFAKLNFPQ